jgi:S-adenosylmethionine:tRNA-ribosyltransferase-isomerase (queuine synthetase)
MSEFLMVAPEGWLTADMTVIQTMLDEASLAYAAENEPATIEDYLEQTGQLPVGTYVTRARLFKDGEVFHMWFQVADRPDK